MSMVKTMWKTKTEMEKQSSSSPGTHMDKVGPRQQPLEAIQGGVSPKGENMKFSKKERDPMMMINDSIHTVQLCGQNLIL